MWTTNYKSFSKNILFYMSSQLSKIRSVHTMYVMPRTVYFGWICILLMNLNWNILSPSLNKKCLTKLSLAHHHLSADAVYLIALCLFFLQHNIYCVCWLYMVACNYSLNFLMKKVRKARICDIKIYQFFIIFYRLSSKFLILPFTKMCLITYIWYQNP